MDKRNHFKIPAQYIFLILLGFAPLILRAQDTTKQLLLQDAIQMAIEQNRQIGLAKKDEKIAQSQYKQTESIWLPQVSLSYSGFVSNQPLSAFGFKMQQAGVKASDFAPAVLNHPGATSNVLTQLSVQQPIYNADLSYMRKAAAKQIEMYGYQTQRARDAVEMQVTNAYLQLEFSYEVVKLLEDALKTVQDINRFTNDRYQQGLLQKSDLLNVAVQVKIAETNLAEAKSQIIIMSDQLGLLMNSSSGIVYKTMPAAIGVADSLNSISVNRADIKAMQTAMEAYDLSIKSTKMSKLPKVNAFANYQFNDKNIVGFGANGYLAGLQISWDIFNRNQAKNKMATQVLEKSKIQEQLANSLAQDAIAVSKTKRQLADAEYRIAQQLDAVASATESQRITQNRYEQGLVNTTDVLTAQTQLAQQKMMYEQAIFTKKTMVTYLNFLTTVKRNSL